VRGCFTQALAATGGWRGRHARARRDAALASSRAALRSRCQELFQSMVIQGASAPKQAPTPPQSTGR